MIEADRSYFLPLSWPHLNSCSLQLWSIRLCPLQEAKHVTWSVNSLMWFRKSYVPISSKTHRNTDVTQVDLINSGHAQSLFLMHQADRCWCTEHKLNHTKQFLKDTACCLYSAYESFVKRSQVLEKHHGFAGSLFSDDYFFWSLVCQTGGVRSSRMPQKGL